MKLIKRLEAYKQQTAVIVREEKISETIQKSKEAFLLQEQEQTISYTEFLIGQFRLIQKRWWFLQALLLGMTGMILPVIQDRNDVMKLLGIIAVLFVVLIVPEFWKNRTCDCMQVEAACLYTMRQIYAARMLLFGIVDLLILTCFCIFIRGNLGFAAKEVLIQFCFPMLVSACICFGILCSNIAMNESTAVLSCLLWSVIWSVIVVNETLYMAITFPIWCILSGAAMSFLLRAVYKTLNDCNQYWEVNINGITNG